MARDLLSPRLETPCEKCGEEEARHQVTFTCRLLAIGTLSFYTVKLGSMCYAEWILEPMPQSVELVKA